MFKFMIGVLIVSVISLCIGRLDKNDLNARIGELVKKIEEVKVEVYDSLQKKYADFFPNLNAAVDLQQRVKDIQEEMESTISKIESEVCHIRR